jgi:hypothetical protein
MKVAMNWGNARPEFFFFSLAGEGQFQEEKKKKKRYSLV